MVCSW